MKYCNEITHMIALHTCTCSTISVGLHVCRRTHTLTTDWPLTNDQWPGHWSMLRVFKMYSSKCCYENSNIAFNSELSITISNNICSEIWSIWHWQYWYISSVNDVFKRASFWPSSWHMALWLWCCSQFSRWVNSSGKHNKMIDEDALLDANCCVCQTDRQTDRQLAAMWCVNSSMLSSRRRYQCPLRPSSSMTATHW